MDRETKKALEYYYKKGYKFPAVLAAIEQSAISNIDWFVRAEDNGEDMWKVMHQHIDDVFDQKGWPHS